MMFYEWVFHEVEQSLSEQFYTVIRINKISRIIDLTLLYLKTYTITLLCQISFDEIILFIQLKWGW